MTRRSTTVTEPPARTARRVAVHRWRDPRLLGGVALVLAATVVGARAVDGADESVEYWAVRADVRAGDTVDRDDLVSVRARLDGPGRDVYVRTDAELPAALGDLRWDTDLATGSLVGSSAWVSGSDSRGELPVAVRPGALPTGLAPGDRVDVWVGPGPGDPDVVAATIVARDLRVVDAGEGSSLGAELTRTVVLDVGAETLDGAQVAPVTAGHVTLVRLP